MDSHTISVSTTLDLAREIGLQPVVQACLAQVLTPAFLAAHADACARLTLPLEAGNTWKALDAALADEDPEGMRMLALYLAAACITREKYRADGLSDAMYLDTMGCFYRFLEEEHARSDTYTFNRGYWAWRHVSFQLFRLGTLEYEYCLTKWGGPLPQTLAPGQPILSVHIPSDARLKDDALVASYRQADEFFAGIGSKYCLYGAPKAIYCHTWLLSKTLRGLLPPTSGILRFGDDYDIYADDLQDESFYTWLFDGKRPPQPLADNTSLRRAVIDYLAQGGTIGAGYGIVTRDR